MLPARYKRTERRPRVVREATREQLIEEVAIYKSKWERVCRRYGALKEVNRALRIAKCMELPPENFLVVVAPRLCGRWGWFWMRLARRCGAWFPSDAVHKPGVYTCRWKGTVE